MSTNGGMQLACFIRLFLLISTVCSTAIKGDNKYGLDLIHEQMGFLMDENQKQNHEIALLKEIVGDKCGIRQPKVAEQPQDQHQQLKLEDSTMIHGGHHYSPEKARNIKRPARLLPLKLLYGERRNETESNTIRFYGPATNCSDLVRLGYTLNGFYMVTAPGKGNLTAIRDTSQLETVFCGFKQPEGFLNSVLEKRIPQSPKLDNNIIRSNTGNSSSSVEERPPLEKLGNTTRPIENCAGTGIYFHANRVTERREREHSREPRNESITYNHIRLNMGNGMIIGNGYSPNDTFKAPKSGIYQFVFTAVMSKIPKNKTSIVSLNHRKSLNHQQEIVSRSSTAVPWNSIAIGATLELNKGDKIFVVTEQGRGYEIFEASFSGSLLKALD